GWDEVGLDRVSAGGTIAWAMECAERGLIDAPWLRFGDADALLRALDEIGERRGLGELVAEGSRRAAERVGGGSAAFAPHVKGMEMPGYEPRTLQAMALGLAVNARGADHNRSGAYEADLSGEHDRLAGGPAHVAAAVETEDRGAGVESPILGKFLRGGLTHPLSRRGAPLAAGARRGGGGGGAAARRRPDRAGQAGVQHRGGLAAGGRLAAGAAAGRAAPARVRARGRADPGAAARHDRRLLRGARSRRAGPAGSGGPGRPPAGQCRDTIDGLTLQLM